MPSAYLLGRYSDKMLGLFTGKSPSSSTFKHPLISHILTFLYIPQSLPLLFLFLFFFTNHPDSALQAD
jgi:hypothetical protein